jgi:hypothetical protein
LLGAVKAAVADTRAARTAIFIVAIIVLLTEKRIEKRLSQQIEERESSAQDAKECRPRIEHRQLTTSIFFRGFFTILGSATASPTTTIMNSFPSHPQSKSIRGYMSLHATTHSH